MNPPARPSLRPLLPVLAGACMLLILSFGYRAGFGLFMQPMSEARGWGRDVLALALAVQNLAWGVFAVLAGGVADRWGNLRVLLSAVALYAAGMWLMAFSATELEIVSTAGLLVGAGVSGTSFGIVLPALARAAPPERRGWALGVGTAAGSFGQFLVVPGIQLVVDAAGWQATLQYLGLSAFVMALFALPLARYGGDREPAGAGGLDAMPLRRVAAGAFRSGSYVLLTLGFFVCGFQVAFMTVHLPAHVADLGFSAGLGAASLSLIGLCNIFGAYYAGALSGRFPMRRLLSFIYLARAAVIACFLALPPSAPGVLAFSAAMGFLWLSTVPLTSGLVAVFFGTRYMTLLYGIVFLGHQAGSFIGVWLGGWAREVRGDYDLVWLAGILLGLAAAGLHWPIRERDQTERLAAAA